WSFDLASALDGMAKSRGMSKGRIAGDAFGKPNTMRDRHVFEKFFGALMDVEETQLQIEHWLASYAEQKMARLDNPRMDGADRNLEHAFALDFAQVVPLSFKRG